MTVLTFTPSEQPVAAPADQRPCEMYLDHGSARPVITQGHHIFPVFLQKRIWGEVRIDDRMWLCGTCHDTVHAWLYWLLRMWPEPTVAVPRRPQARAQQAYDWYVEASAA